MWQEVLKVDRVGVQDNFFSLGGDSILSIRVVSLLKSRGIPLDVKDIFQHQTVEQLAMQAGQAAAGEQAEPLEPFALLTEQERSELGDGRYEDAYPMSALQAGMVFHTQMEQFSGIYHDIIAEHVRCPWDRACFEYALSVCMQEQPLLRTVFKLEGERPLQVVLGEVEPPLEVEDLRGQSAEQQERYLEQWTEARKRHEFDWERGPLLQVNIFLRTDDSFQFVLSFHHSVLDGWSRAVLTTVLYNRYERLLSGQELEAVEENWTYREFIAQEQRVLADGGAKQYFARMLEEAPGEQLPRLRSKRGERAQGLLVVEALIGMSERLIGLARELGVPVQSVLMAGHLKVLSVMSGQSRAVSCVTHNGRPETQGAERSLGLFLNSVPVSVEVGPCTWRELIERVRQVGAAGMQYRGYPLSRIQQDVGISLDEVTFNYTHFHVYRDLTTETEHKLEVLGSSGFEQTNFDFLVNVGRGLDDVLRMELIYKGGQFGREMMERVSGYYERVYEQMLEGLDGRHQVRTLLSEEEERQVIRWGAGAEVETSPLCVHELFERQADKTPHAVAVVCSQQSLSYLQLNQKADRLARYLAEAGVGIGSRVGIHLRRSAEMMIAVLGVMKAGAAYVPLEAGLPSQRVEYMMRDAGVECVLVESGLMEGMRLSGVDVVMMDGAATDPAWLEEMAGEATEAVRRVRADDLAYILYTSGLTGKPKGVMVEHQGLSNYLSHAAKSYLKEGIKGSVVSSPLSFDATLTTLMTPLVAGGSVELLEEDEGLIERLADRMFGTEEGLLFKVTPSHLEALEYVDRSRRESDARHVVVVGGEQLRAELVRRWKGEMLREAVFVNEYGPTEAVVGCSVWELRDDEGMRKLEGMVGAPIGRPIANTQMYVMGEGCQLQPIGSVGELYIGGAGVARGYVKDEEKTRERFIEDPYEEGERVYRTGDLVRWREEGELEFVGRRDEQVKVRGYRIELGEIEQELRGVEGVEGAVVVAREVEGGQKQLVGYVVIEEEAKRRASEAEMVGELRDSLRKVLPDYMVPTRIVVLEQLPLTPNGKVDRKALPAPEEVEREKYGYVGPRNGTEQALCEVWQEVLNRDQIGIHDNFFSLGGDSILSIRVISLLKSRGIPLDVKDIFQHQTVEQLAMQAGQAAAGEQAEPLEPFALLTEQERSELGDGRYEDAYPMSALQAGMVFHTQMEQFSGIYHDIMAEHVRCAWDRECFERALAACIEEQPILRTGFLLDRRQPLQVVYRTVELPLEVEDLRGQTQQEQESYLADWIEQRKRHEFDWERGPLLQVNIFLRTDDSFQFVLSFHHSVLDGWSRAVLTTVLYNRYERLLSGQELEAVEENWTYREFIAQEQRVLADGGAKQYFAGMLEEAPGEQLPRLRSKGGQRAQGLIVVEQFVGLSERLIGLARELGVPVQSVLMAGHLKVLSVMSGQSRAVTCVTHNGRPETQGAERSLGLYLNSLPQGLEVRRCSWRRLIEAVVEMNACGMQYRGYPLSRIQQELDWTFSEVLFNYTHFHIYNELTKGGGNELESLGSSGFEQTNFDLLVDVARGMDDALRLSLVYDKQVFDREMIQRLGQYYLRAFEQMLEGLDQPHHSLLSESERNHLLYELNSTQADYPREVCLTDLFEQQVERSPEAVAVVFEGQRLSYRELNEQANQLAHYLRAQGVRPDSLVGLCVERSVEMVVGIIGILKAGGAYLPLDPSYPQERLDYMIEDSRPAVVLTQSWLEERLPLVSVPVLRLDTELEELREYSSDNAGLEEVGLRPEHLAYVIYTSGSTGKPKGVMVEHRNVGRLLSVTEADFGFGAQDVWTLFHSYAFDFSVWEMWGALAYGGRLVVVPKWVSRSPEDFYRLVVSEGVTVLNQTPTAFTQLARVDAERQEELKLRVVVFGGEALKLSELRGWVERHGEEKPELVNMYGITETTVHVTYRRLRREDVAGDRGSVIGRALGDLRVYVLGEDEELMPEGAVGEMYVGGGGVARGYLNREELTRERFIEDRYEEGERVYRTGDLARWTEEGELEYVGRKDAQVKVRGYRIELGEIEHELGRMEMVSGAVVVARQGEGGQKRLVGYVVIEEEAKRAESEAEMVGELRDALQRRLPDYMVPAHFVLLDQLPLTANGKVDRKALPAPDAGDVEAAYLAPRNETEQALCEVWQEVLKVDRVGVQDNFFSLGGDSILSIRVVSLLKSRGIPLDVKDIFQHQTVEQLAMQAGQAAAGEQAEPLEPFALLTEQERSELGDGRYEDAYPMSALQAGMVFHTQMEQFSGIYHDIIAEHVRCPWDRACFEYALSVCMQEQPLLRTVFKLEGERPLQVVLGEVEPPLEVEDLRGQSAEQQERYLEQWTEARKRHEFDWERGPLLQVNIFLRTDDSFQFVLSFHHSVLDGWSRAVLTTVLYNRYERLLSGQELEAVEENWTYREFIAQEQRVLADGGAKQYFARMLEEAPGEQLPRLRSKGGQRAQGLIVVEQFVGLSERLIGLARELGVPVQSVLMAGHLKVLTTMSGQSRAVTCVTHNGRPETQGAERSLGLFLNSVPVSVEVGPCTWRELIERVRQVGAAGMQYRGYPLSRIQQDVGISLDEVTFNYTHFHVYRDLTTETEHKLEVLGSSGFEQTNFDFLVNVGRGLDDVLRMELIYKGGQFGREIMERLGQYYVRAFEQMLEGLDGRHQVRTLLSEEEERQVIEWGAGAEVETSPSVRARVDRAAGRQDPPCRGGSLLAAEPQLPTAKPEGRQARSLPGRGWSGHRIEGGHTPEAVSRDDDSSAWGDEGRGCICAFGGGAAQPASRVHDEGCGRGVCTGRERADGRDEAERSGRGDDGRGGDRPSMA